MNVFAKKVKIALMEQGRTQASLADELGIKHGNFSRKLRINNMSEKDMHAISAALGLRLKIELEEMKKD